MTETLIYDELSDSAHDKNKQYVDTYLSKKLNLSFENKIVEDSDNILDEAIDRIRQQINQAEPIDNLKSVEVQVLLGTTLTLTAGYVSWILRGGALLTSFLSTVPLFKRFDPVPILKSKDRDKFSESENDSEDSYVEKVFTNVDDDDYEN